MTQDDQPAPIVTGADQLTPRGGRLRGLLIACTLGVGALLAPPHGRAPTRPGIYRLLGRDDDRFDPRERVANLVLTLPLIAGEQSTPHSGRNSPN
jgi:hypothetical protein